MHRESSETAPQSSRSRATAVLSADETTCAATSAATRHRARPRPGTRSNRVRLASTRVGRVRWPKAGRAPSSTLSRTYESCAMPGQPEISPESTKLSCCRRCAARNLEGFARPAPAESRARQGGGGENFVASEDGGTLSARRVFRACDQGLSDSAPHAPKAFARRIYGPARSWAAVERRTLSRAAWQKSDATSHAPPSS